MNNYAIADMMVMQEEPMLTKAIKKIWWRITSNHEMVFKSMFEDHESKKAYEYFQKLVRKSEGLMVKYNTHTYAIQAIEYFFRIGELEELWRACDLIHDHSAIEKAFVAWSNGERDRKNGLRNPYGVQWIWGHSSHETWFEYAFQMEYRKANSLSARIYDTLGKPVDATRCRMKMAGLQ